MSPIESNLQHVRRALDTAASSTAGTARGMVSLVAVSKTQPAAAVRAAFAAGQRAFGENYVQEGVAKIAALADLRPSGIEWHFIGPLQSNKARLVAENFDWMHGVDRLKIAEAVARHRLGPPLNVCLQVNISHEASKSGIAAADIPALARDVSLLPGLALRGLMAIIENSADEAVQRAQFRAMRRLFDQLNDAGIRLDTLSMGMSQDYRIAIEEGSTMVRIGSAIFGART